MKLSVSAIQKKWLVALLAVVLAGLTLVVLLLLTDFSFVRLLQTEQQTTQLTLNQVTPRPLASPLTEPLDTIQPIVKECLFSYFDACVERISVDFINTDNRYQDFAEFDIPYLLSYHQTSSLAGYRETPSSAILQEYFSELVSTSSATPTPLPVAQIIQQVSMKENINPRILLVLMEVLHDGKGPVLSPSQHPQSAYFDSAQQSTFTDQLTQVASQLRQHHLKYQLMVHDGQTLPASLKLYERTYQVNSQTNPATLALLDFLATNIKDKNRFERAIVVAPSEGIPENNFVELYSKLFNVDPIKNIDVSYSK